MAKTYGNTWWGQQWLNALTKIDLSNRLPRGRTYANKGAVDKLEIKDNLVSASVRGSFRSSYKIKIEIPQLKAYEKAQLIESVISDDLVLTQLLSQQLPSEFTSLARSQGISLFPDSWRSLGMRCSCPDYAVPCKHLAAVIYKLSEEIDRNPFLILKLKGLDVTQELNKAGFELDQEDRHRATTLEDCITQGDNPEPGPDANLRPDLSAITDIGENTLRLLSEKPLFYSKDFRAILKKSYAKLVKTSKAWERKERPEGKYAQALKTTEGLTLVTGPDWEFKALLSETEDKQERLMARSEDLDNFLGELFNDPTLATHHPDAKALKAVIVFFLKLAQNKALTPRLVAARGEAYRIQWVPATSDPAVKKAFDSIAQALPENIVAVQTSRGNISFLKPAERLNTLCDLFVEPLISENALSLQTYSDTHTDKKVFGMFFDGQPATFRNTLEAAVPDTVHMWLRKLYLTEKRHAPALVITENKNETFSLTVEVTDGDKNVALQAFLEKHSKGKEKFELLKDLRLLAEYLPELNAVIRHGQQSVEFGLGKFESILFHALPVIGMLGIRITMPRSLRKVLAPQLSMNVTKNTNETGKAYLSLANMLDFEWRIALGNELVGEEEFRKLVSKRRGLVKFRDSYVRLDPSEIDKLLRKLDNPPKVNENDILQAALSERYDGTLAHLSPEVRDIIEEFTKDYEIEPPAGLKATLRHYQQRGYAWLYKNSRLGLGSLLADDMGLGKTLQTIAALAKFKEDGLLDPQKALVVVPTSLLTNWRKEIERFAPGLRASVYHGTKREIPEEFDVLITTYGMVRSESKLFRKVKWFALIIDEAQNIKNVSTEQTKAVKALKAEVKIALSGTPVENRLSEYWSVMDFVNKGYLGPLKRFTDKVAKPIQNDRNQTALDTFRKVTAPFILRRLKSDKSIISDLPDKTEQDRYCNLTKEQAGVYQNVIDRNLKAIDEAEEGIQRKGMVLKMLTVLKQVCNHPAQFLKKGAEKPELSGKTKILFEVLDQCHETGEKVLIFTQYKEMGEMIANWTLERYGHPALFLHGGTSRNKRDEMVERFQNDPMRKVFVLSIKAGGTGLNLTAASHVIHYDLWWNPAVEAQATDRAYRIGQKNNVLVHRLICEGTFEEKIDEMIKSKKELADMAVTQGEKWIGDLDTDSLGELVSLAGGE
ncbi:helicase (plasmid) [Fulvitalea axinellae]|uniref:Helicase n=1 Tax=Fulvitalea axinellae TaxID=1182444 RepID=A0AAU9CR86_9BACT|nr:helicase [Fulvitalea axinellae]